MQKDIKEINFAYKCFAIEEGVVFLFEKIDPFKDEEINVRLIEGEVFLEMKNNVALLTENIRKYLIQKPNIFLCSCKFDLYEGSLEPYWFKVDEKLLLKLEGILEAMKVMSSEDKSQNRAVLEKEKEAQSTNHSKNQKSSEVYIDQEQ